MFISMESCIGEYITKQYGLLKQILSYLQPSELWTARQVCRDWKSAVDSLIDKNPQLIIHRRSDASVPVMPRPLLPVFVISHSSEDCQFNHSSQVQEFKVNQCSKCKERLLICPCTVNGPDTLFLKIKTCGKNFATDPESALVYEYWQTYFAFLLPSSEKIQVSTFCERDNTELYSTPMTQDVVNMCLGGEEPIKCLLIFLPALKNLKKRRFIDNLLNAILNRQGLTFALGGGDVKYNVKFKKGNPASMKWEEIGLVLVALRGENLLAESDVLDVYSEQGVEVFMQDLAEKVGPLPEGGSRMGFVSQCVDRTCYEIEQHEYKAFKKTFPAVPLIGFRAYGEYGIQSCTGNDNSNYGVFAVRSRDKKKKRKMTFHYGGTSSFVILTFKKV